MSLQQIYLKKYKELGSNPNIVRVVDAPNNSHLPAKLVDEALLLHSIVPHRKIICQCVDFVSKDGQLYFSNQKFSIPVGYNGWLEILSEDGKAVSPSRTIEHIASKLVERFLVRSRTKAYLGNANNGPDYDSPIFIEKGVVVKVVSQLSVVHGWRRQKKHVLHCNDTNGCSIYFDFKTTGQFSPIAGPTNIPGVHSIESLISQFRLPLTVRIVSGKIPRIASDNDRPGVFRLIESQKDNTALFLPTRSHQKLIPVSIRTNIQLIQAANMIDISQHEYYRRLLSLCNKKVDKYFRTIQVLVSARQQPKIYSSCTLPVRKKSSESTIQVIKSPSMNTEEDILFAEVDDLYAYVRRGGVPPKSRPRSWATNTDGSAILMTAEGKSSSQPMLAMGNGKPRGLLATLTAGKFPSKSSTLVRQYKVSQTPTTPDQTPLKTLVLEAGTLPVTRRTDKTRSYIEKYHGSMESLQTEVDPYVDEWQYKDSNESLDFTRRIPHQQSQKSQKWQRILRPRPFSTSFELIQTKASHSPDKADNSHLLRNANTRLLL